MDCTSALFLSLLRISEPFKVDICLQSTPTLGVAALNDNRLTDLPWSIEFSFGPSRLSVCRNTGGCLMLSQTVPLLSTLD